MAEPTPFDRLFAPDSSGSLFGTIGRAFGVQSGAERSGQASGEALKGLADLQAQGMTPQQAIVKYMQSPAGIDAFTNNPGLMDQLTRFGAATTPPPAQITTAGPGQGVFSTDRNTNQTTNVGNVPSLPQTHVVGPGSAVSTTNAQGQTNMTAPVPTQDTQQFKEMASLANLPDDALQEIARVKALPISQQPTEQARAIQTLQSKYGLDPVLGQKFLAGALKVTPMYNFDGQHIGNAVQDVLNGITVQGGGNIRLNQPGSRTDATKPTVQITPQAVNPDGTVKPDKVFDDKNTMFLGTGISPILAQYLGNTLGQVSSTLVPESSQRASGQRDYIQQLHTALISLRDNSSGLGIPIKAIDSVTNLAPGFGPLVDNLTSVQNGRRLLGLVQNEIQAAENATIDPNVAQSERINASKRIESWRRVERAMPTMDNMQKLEEALKTGTAGQLTPSSIYKDVKTGVQGAVKQGQKEVDTASGTETTKGAPSIQTMKPSELLALDPAKLTSDQRAMLRSRIDQLVTRKKQ